MGIHLKRPQNKIGNSLTYVKADTTLNEVVVYINGAIKNKWK